MTAATARKQTIISVERANPDAPVLYAAGKEWIGILAGTVVQIDDRSHIFETDTSLAVAGTLVPGYDYGVSIDDDGKPSVTMLTANPLGASFFAGFHFAPSGCAEHVNGGTVTAAINPYSIWDIGFRPACPDPRGMALVEVGSRRVWVDIYLLGIDHGHGTSRCGVTIADGCDLPDALDGKGKFRKLDYPTAVEIYAHHGKRLLEAEEFFTAAYGVKERSARNGEPKVTGTTEDDAKHFVSKWGIFDATGTMWQWGTDGHPDDPRPSIFGGSWFHGANAGSRCAYLVLWPEYSAGSLSARGACDHLNPA